MKSETFDKLVADRLDHCKDLLCSKGEEYSRGADRLWNFKVAARVSGKTKYAALLGMWMKHVVSVLDIIEDANGGELPGIGLLNEKISDNINYLLLLEGLLLEGEDE